VLRRRIETTLLIGKVGCGTQVTGNPTHQELAKCQAAPDSGDDPVGQEYDLADHAPASQ
jgi:hypothetical protein